MNGATVLDVSNSQHRTSGTTQRALIRRATRITELELDTYRRRTRRSQEANRRAWESLPSGVASSFQLYDPHPIMAAKAEATDDVPLPACR